MPIVDTLAYHHLLPEQLTTRIYDGNISCNQLDRFAPGPILWEACNHFLNAGNIPMGHATFFNGIKLIQYGIVTSNNI